MVFTNLQVVTNPRHPLNICLCPTGQRERFEACEFDIGRLSLVELIYTTEG